jgi:hypothetical protein
MHAACGFLMCEGHCSGGSDGRNKWAQVAEWLMAADCKSAALVATKVRILPCAPYFFRGLWFVVRGLQAGWGEMKMAPSGDGRLVVALTVLAVLAVLVWRTMEPGKFQQLSWLLLGFFALRVVLGWRRSRKMGDEEPVRNGDGLDV